MDLLAAIRWRRYGYDTTVPSSEIGRMFSLVDLKADKNLSSAVVNLHQAVEGNRCPNATKVGFVINTLRSLYRRNVLKYQWDTKTKVGNGTIVHKYPKRSSCSVSSCWAGAADQDSRYTLWQLISNRFRPVRRKPAIWSGSSILLASKASLFSLAPNPQRRYLQG